MADIKAVPLLARWDAGVSGVLGKQSAGEG
jgi:hypothetical protein